MRADRLIQMLILLQERGRMSAAALASELEVSVRTIFRDLDALSVSGFPVYAEAGRNGGYELLGNFRTDLTGFKTEELLALLVSGTSSSVGALGLEQTTGNALRKLAAALPETQRMRVRWYRERILIDSVGREHTTIGACDPDGGVDLSIVYRAVLESRKLRIRVVWSRPDQAGEYEVLPLGLVESGGSWYLVAGLTEYAKIYPLEVLSKVLVRPETFERPASFSLEEFWQEWKEEQKKIRGAFVTRLVVSPDVIVSLDRQVREDLRQMLESLKSDDSGRYTLDVTFDHLSHARNFILIHGGAVRVVEPEALKRSVIDYAWETLGQYGAENRLPPAYRDMR